MNFIYNETDEKLSMTCREVNGETKIVLNVNSGAEQYDLISTKDADLATSIKNRYQNGRELVHNPSREYTTLKDKRILVNANTSEYVVSELVSVDKSERPQEYVKNVLVLVMKPDTRYYVKQIALRNRMFVKPFNTEEKGKVKVAVLYIKSFNWSSLREPISILMQAGDGNHKQLILTSETKTDAKSGTQFDQNVINVSDYTGEFPKPRENTDAKPRYNKNNTSGGGYHKRNNSYGSRDNNGYRENNKDRNYGKRDNNNRTRGGYSSGFNNRGNGKELVIPKFEDHSSRSQTNRKKHR